MSEVSARFSPYFAEEVWPGLAPEVRERLRVFSEDVVRFGRSQNLVSRKDPVGEVARLIEESVRGGALLLSLGAAGPARWLDVGSGAGFPGVVLGILYPGAQVALVERRAARCDFLERVSLRLGLSGVSVVSHDVRSVALEPFEGVSSKAVTDPLEFLGWVDRLMVSGAPALFFQRRGWGPPEGWRTLDSKVTLEQPGREERMAFLIGRV